MFRLFLVFALLTLAFPGHSQHAQARRTCTIDFKTIRSNQPVPEAILKMTFMHADYIADTNINIKRRYSYNKFITVQKLLLPDTLRRSLAFERDTFIQKIEEPFFRHFADNRIDFANLSGPAPCLLYFGKCQFRQPVLFASNQLGSHYLTENSFSDKLYFENMNLQALYFMNNKTGGDVYMDQCNGLSSYSYRYTNFYQNTVRGSVFITRSILRDYVIADNQIDHVVHFQETEMKGNLFVEGNTLGGMNFNYAILPDTLIFNDNILLGDISLQNAGNISTRKNKPCVLLVYNTDLSRFNLNYSYFKIVPYRFRNAYQQAERMARDEGIAMYEQLLKNFKDRGQLESYKKLDIEYQHYKWATGPRAYRWVGGFLDLWWKFGYEKYRIFIWTFVLLLLLAIPIYRWIILFQVSIYPIPSLNRYFPEILEKENYYKSSLFRIAVKDRIWCALVYTASIFLRLTLKTDQVKVSANYRIILGTIYLLLVFSAGLICLGYIANFVIN